MGPCVARARRLGVAVASLGSDTDAMPHALLVDDDAGLEESLREVVEEEGFSFESAATLEIAREVVARRVPDLALIDVSLPDGDGFELLRDLEGTSATEVVLVSGGAGLDGCPERVTDYLTKPVDLGHLRSILASVARRRELTTEVERLRAELRSLGRFGPLIGASSAMHAVYDQIARVAPTGAPVLLQGESGTGKALVARAVHDLSRRRRDAFVALDCGAVAPGLLEAEIFGHEHGAVPGTDRVHRGAIERAHGGTFFLDELTALPSELQLRLLRVLESGRLRRAGGESELPVDVRVLAATTRDPDDAVASGALRQDLLYRLRVATVRLPALRHRTGDVPLLAEHFLGALNRNEDAHKHLSRAAIDALRAYRWPGNVRELYNAVHAAFVLADGEIRPEVLPAAIRDPVLAAAAATTGPPVVELRVGIPIAEAERRLILATLAACDGKKEKAALVLGISVKTLYNRLHEYREQGGSVPA